jgi:hypothetical protein
MRAIRRAKILAAWLTGASWIGWDADLVAQDTFRSIEQALAHRACQPKEKLDKKRVRMQRHRSKVVLHARSTLAHDARFI